MQNRTDLALELKEEKNIGSAESGIIVRTINRYSKSYQRNKVTVTTGDKSFGRSSRSEDLKGAYLTIEADEICQADDEEYCHKGVPACRDYIFKLLKRDDLECRNQRESLIAGLGDR